jgi:hypothetical protein
MCAPAPRPLAHRPRDSECNPLERAAFTESGEKLDWGGRAGGRAGGRTGGRAGAQCGQVGREVFADKSGNVCSDVSDVCLKRRCI